MNRRQFIKNMIATTVAISTTVAILKTLKPEAPVRPLTDAEKECIIAEMLKTPEGRMALAKAMVEPIRGPLLYNEVGRRILQL